MTNPSQFIAILPHSHPPISTRVRQSDHPDWEQILSFACHLFYLAQTAIQPINILSSNTGRNKVHETETLDYFQADQIALIILTRHGADIWFWTTGGNTARRALDSSGPQYRHCRPCVHSNNLPGSIEWGIWLAKQLLAIQEELCPNQVTKRKFNSTVTEWHPFLQIPDHRSCIPFPTQILGHTHPLKILQIETTSLPTLYKVRNFQSERPQVVLEGVWEQVNSRYAQVEGGWRNHVLRNLTISTRQINIVKVMTLRTIQKRNAL
jgi:hypothetical protein